MVKIMVADVLATLGARVSAAMVLTYLSQNIPIKAQIRNLDLYPMG